jgi:hypothetical protein
MASRTMAGVEPCASTILESSSMMDYNQEVLHFGEYDMSTTSYTGTVYGKSEVLENSESPLPDGTRVLVTPLSEPGTSDALLAAIQAEPLLAAEDVAELEAVLEDKGKPPSRAFLGSSGNCVPTVIQEWSGTGFIQLTRT